MNLPVFLDVVIGIAFMYLMLSLMCTVVNEIVATVFKLRAKYLARAIVRIIDNPDIRAAFYNHGLVSDAQAAAGGVPQVAGARGAKTDAEGKPKDDTHPSYIDSRNFALALLDSLDPDHQKDPKSQLAFPTFADVTGLVQKMDDSAIRDVLLANLAVSKADIVSLRDNLAAWFDTAMDRLSGEYKRVSKLISILVGIGIATAVNADSWRVGAALWNDDGLRTAVAAVAKAETPATACTDADLAAQDACLGGEFKKAESAFRPLPLGWTRGDLWSGGAGNLLLWLLLKALMFLWTGLALSLGAPFWFDLLQKVMNIRGSGPNPAEKKGTQKP